MGRFAALALSGVMGIAPAPFLLTWVCFKIAIRSLGRQAHALTLGVESPGIEVAEVQWQGASAIFRLGGARL
jgi:hypothetical protein